MLGNEVIGIFDNALLWPKVLVILAGLLCLGLLLFIILHPFISKTKLPSSIQMHPQVDTLLTFNIPSFQKVAIALDFSANDQKLLAYAIGQGKENTHYLLIHIVESTSAKIFGNESDDYETRNDKERMDSYVSQLQKRGLNTEGIIGFRNRAKEIVRIVKSNNADMLVMGAHGHTAMKDFIFGQTVNTVRHELKIPVLIVTL